MTMRRAKKPQAELEPVYVRQELAGGEAVEVEQMSLFA